MKNKYFIEDKEITFVIQGPLLENTKDTIDKVKYLFPDSPIVLTSTSDVRDCQFSVDKIVFSEDPGFFYYSKDKNEKANNVNRQIVSTLAGLKEVRTKYCFKLRSDFFLQGKDFLKYFFKYRSYDEKFKIFESKILASCYFTRIPTSKMPYPFHISDLCFFGLTEDLIKLYDVPLMKEEDAYCIGKLKRNRYFPEQHILVQSLKKQNRYVNLRYYDDNTQQNILKTEKYFASNFILLNFEQFCIRPTKDVFSLRKYPDSFSTCYTHSEWEVLYRNYVDKNFKVSGIDTERIMLNYQNTKLKRKRFLANIISAIVIIPFFRRKLRNKILNYLR